METKFKVKDNSIQEFVTKYVINNFRDDSRERPNPYYIFGKGDVVVKSELAEDYGLSEGQSFEIELHDRARESGRDLVNTYTYELADNDSISRRLVLIDFKVELK